MKGFSHPRLPHGFHTRFRGSAIPARVPKREPAHRPLTPAHSWPYLLFLYPVGGGGGGALGSIFAGYVPLAS